jgi:hypothetical protein
MPAYKDRFDYLGKKTMASAPPWYLPEKMSFAKEQGDGFCYISGGLF